MIPVDVKTVVDFLKRTPSVLRDMLEGLDDDWIHANEGSGAWTPHDVVAHLIFGEQTDWIPRMQIILDDREDKHFIPFDMKGHVQVATGRTLESLLHQFEQLRKENILILLSADITEDDLKKKGIHPAFGDVTLSQLLASWMVHDMTHISQIARTFAKQYEQAVGPWKAYMGVLNR